VSLFRVFQTSRAMSSVPPRGATIKAASDVIVTSLVDGISEFLVGLATTSGELSNQVVMMTNPNSVAVAALPSCRGWNGLA